MADLCPSAAPKHKNLLYRLRRYRTPEGRLGGENRPVLFELEPEARDRTVPPLQLIVVSRLHDSEIRSAYLSIFHHKRRGPKAKRQENMQKTAITTAAAVVNAPYSHGFHKKRIPLIHRGDLPRTRCEDCCVS